MISVVSLACSGAEVSDCGHHLVVTTQQDCRDNLLYSAPLPETITTKINLNCIVDTFEADYEVSFTWRERQPKAVRQDIFETNK